MTKLLETGRDWLGAEVHVGDTVVHFKGGRYDRLDYGVVTAITKGGNFRITIIRSTRSDVSRGEENVYAVHDRTVRMDVTPVPTGPTLDYFSGLEDN